MKQADGWYSDPTGRHELRYWGGGEWSAAISDQNVLGSDPVDTDTLPGPTGLSTAEQREEPATAPQAVAPPAAAALASSTVSAAGLAPPTLPPGAPGALPYGPPPQSDPAAHGAPPPPGAPLGPPPGAPHPPPGYGVVGAHQDRGRSGERLRTGAPGPLAFAAMLYGGPAVFLCLYGAIAVLLGVAFNNADDPFDQVGGALLVLALVVLVFGVAYAATAVGLSMAASWARVGAFVLAGVQVLGALYTTAEGAPGALLLLVYPALCVGLVLAPSSGVAFARRRINASEVERPTL